MVCMDGLDSEENEAMFRVHCHIHRSDVLLDWSRIEALRTTASGPVLDWHCWCGARGSLVRGVRSVPRGGSVAA
jgi:hypothetical protein